MHIYLYFTNTNNIGQPYLCVNKNTTIDKLTTTGVSYPMVDTFTSNGLPSYIGTNPKTNGIVVGAIYGFTFKTIGKVSYWVRDYSPQNFEVDTDLNINSLNPISNKVVTTNINKINTSIGGLNTTVKNNTTAITNINSKFPATGVGSTTKGIYLNKNGTFATTSQMLPLSAGTEYPLDDCLAFSANAKNKAYGDTLPVSAQNGQIFFKKGNEKPLILRKDYFVTSKIVANTSVPLSNYTGSVITSSTNLEVFHNGILLNSDGSHYAIDSKNNISFTYDIKAGDTLAFVQTTPANTIDLSKYLTTTQGNNYIKKTGDTVSGTLNLQSDSTTKSRIIFNPNITQSNIHTDIPLITFSAIHSLDPHDYIIATNHDGQGARTLKINYGTNTVMELQGADHLKCQINTISNSGTIKGSKIYGAVWNDYAEYRICKDNFIPGMIVCENGDDTLSISKERMQPAAAVISDTFGFAIGETNDAKCPIAVSGRVLAIPYEPREEFKKAIGKPVCAGPNGTVSIMTDEEYRDKGYCAIGTISAVPDYATWGTGNVAVNNRIWIKVG